MKILCLGNNDYNTDEYVSHRAAVENTINHGLIEEIDFNPIKSGYYHTTILDLTPKEITKIAPKFDMITILDEPIEKWSHWKVFVSTYKLLKELGKTNRVEIANEEIFRGIGYFQNLVQTNKSFCIYPWVELIEEGGRVILCARCDGKVSSWDMGGRTCYACEGGCQPRMAKVESLPSPSTRGDSGSVVGMKDGQKKKGKKQQPQPKQHVAHR